MKLKLKFSVLTMLVSTVSCTQMLTHRDYLSEMEHDDSSFYRPNQDFPVVAGDTGRTYETSSERRNRTPASLEDKRDQRDRSYLSQELRQLESKQSENSSALYEKYKNHMGSISEKIYFLKLPSYERKEYLLSRGFIKSEPRSYQQSEQLLAQRTNQVSMGMSKDDVMTSLGHPSRVEVAGNPRFENERWLYSRNGASKYIYFESGRVEGWE